MKHIIKLTCFVLITLMTGSCAVNKSMSNSDAVINSVSGKKVISEGGLIY
jgi:hypothetical protein